MEPIKLLQKHCEFNNDYDCYVLLAVSRKKDTPSITNSQEIVFREVIKDERDIIRKYNNIKAQIVNYKDENGTSFPFYLYVSLNARDSKKATYLLMNKILHWMELEDSGVNNSKMFKKVYGHFYSTLMMKESRTKSQKYFMIDYDKKGNLHDFILEMVERVKEGIKIQFTQETKNGWHIKLKPFNRTLLKDIDTEKFPFEVKVDTNFFVEYIKNSALEKKSTAQLQKMLESL